MTTDRRNPPISVAVIPGTGAPDATVCLVGELDLAGVTILATALQERLIAGQFRLRLDLSELTFCDAAGLGVLLEWHRQITAAGGALVLANVRPGLARIMRLTQVDSVLRLSR